MSATYIQRKDHQTRQLETVDEFDTYKEARSMVKEYRLSDPWGDYYISSRACKAWATTDERSKQGAT